MTRVTDIVRNQKGQQPLDLRGVDAPVQPALSAAIDLRLLEERQDRADFYEMMPAYIDRPGYVEPGLEENLVERDLWRSARTWLVVLGMGVIVLIAGLLWYGLTHLS